MKISDLKRFIAPLARRVDNMVARAVVKVVKDSPTMQALQAEVLKGEIRDNLERFQEYGFTSVPLPGAEAVLVFANGDRAHGLAVAVDDRRYRKKGLQGGEVALYTDEGDYILMKRGRVIEVVAGAKLDVTAPEVEIHASTKVTLDTPEVECTTNLTVGGTITSEGKVTANAGLDVLGGITDDGVDVGSTHKHSGVQSGPSNTGNPT